MTTKIPLPPLPLTFGRTYDGRYLELASSGNWCLRDTDGSKIRLLNDFENRLVNAAHAPRAELVQWINEAKRLSRERDLWCWAFGIALLIGTIAGVVLGFAIAQGVL